jgi:diaminohydroxyphosphoribosylaminopyrimidine deaminase/5-amino-6-(5-phosphoribosylamino)uracil reductase|tara:strand:- start:477 stop:1589 length:1113 start_codon:yes stop_codon:yes gene_type:complete
MKDIDFMARAIELAKRGRLRVQPNPMVGCVIVKNNRIIGEGWHQEFGKAHAEINAIKDCKKRFGIKKALKIIAGADMYVNLEPCSIEKNTPPCANALVEHQIKRLFCGTLDPNPKINGRGIKLLKKAGIKIKVGLLRKECKQLNKIFFTNQKKLRPYIILKSAQSIDGKIALKNGESNWISNTESRKDSHRIRSRVKGILVGRGTAEKDNPSLTVRLSKKELCIDKNETIEQPVKIIIGNLKKAKKNNKLFSNNAKVIIGSRNSAKQSKNLEYIEYKEKDFLDKFLKDLLARNISSILVEGGQKTLNTFIAKNLFDELVIYTAPIFLGDGSIKTLSVKAPNSIKNSSKLKTVKIERFKDDIKTTYYNENI